MSDERREAFVAWMEVRTFMGEEKLDWRYLYMADPGERGVVPCVPVVVTPLLPDDPKPGETWMYGNGGTRFMEVTVTGTPFPSADGPRVPADGPDGWFALRIEDMTRPPVLKTFRFNVDALTPYWSDRTVNIQAESKEAAITKLSEALEEVSDG